MSDVQNYAHPAPYAPHRLIDFVQQAVVLSTLDEVNSPKLIDIQNVLDYTESIIRNVLDSFIPHRRL